MGQPNNGIQCFMDLFEITREREKINKKLEYFIISNGDGLAALSWNSFCIIVSALLADKDPIVLLCAVNDAQA